jgi:hypothetical protein
MKIGFYLLSFLLLCGSAVPASAAEDDAAVPEAEETEDTEDAQEKKDEAGGKFLVLPFFITEPAIGEGMGAALIYFHANRNPDAPKMASAQSLNRADREQTPPPTATGAFAFYTNNDTTGYGIGHSRTFKEDTYRLTALLADAKINATYYVSDSPFDFSMDGTVAFARLKRRFGGSSMFVGLSTSLLNATFDFPLNPGPGSGIDLPEFAFKDVGIAASVIYDSRDDTMMPSTGSLAEMSLWRYDDGFGGDFDYTSTTLKVNSFRTFAEKWVLGLRLEATTATGDIPFYAAPYVKLRGIPALRYQGETAGVAEIELRYQFAKRWAVLAFTGEGFTDERGLIDETEDEIDSYGFGLRYQLLTAQNVWVGLDLARGPEEDAFYIQLAHPW